MKNKTLKKTLVKMSNDLSLVTFNVRYEKSTYALKIETPSNVSEFHEKLVKQFKNVLLTVTPEYFTCS